MNHMTYGEAAFLILASIGLLSLLSLISLIIAAFFAPLIENEDDEIGVIGFTRRRAADSLEADRRVEQ